MCEILSVVNHILLRGAEFWVAFDDFVDCFHQVFFGNTLSACANGKHTCFSADTADISTCWIWAKSGDQLETNVFVEGHRLRIDLKDLDSALELWKTELDLSIETTGSWKSGIQSIRPVCCHENFDISSWFKTIKLVDNLKHCSLDFTVAFTISDSTNCIDFIKENDACFLSASKLEKLSDHSCTLTNVPLNKLTSNYSNETSISSVRHSSCAKGLACSWRPKQQDALRWINSKLCEPLRMK